MSARETRERTVRKGSRWRRKSDGAEVTVSFARGGRNADLPWRIVAYCFDRNSGGILHEEDFRDDFEWMAGR